MILLQRLSGLLAVNHPRNAESIDAHAEPDGPEGLLKRHLHRAVFCQGVKDRFRFADSLV